MFNEIDEICINKTYSQIIDEIVYQVVKNGETLGGTICSTMITHAINKDKGKSYDQITIKVRNILLS